MSANLGTYRLGMRPTIVGTFADPSGDGGVVTSVTLHIRTPDGATATAVPTSTVDNVWRYTFPALNQVGRWWVDMSGVSGLIVTEGGHFEVVASDTA